MKEAEKYLTELDYEQSIAEYTLALEIEPNNEEALNALEQNIHLICCFFLLLSIYCLFILTFLPPATIHIPHNRI